jgi:cytochrome c oxidase cbb3-type subunit III
MMRRSRTVCSSRRRRKNIMAEARVPKLAVVRRSRRASLFLISACGALLILMAVISVRAAQDANPFARDPKAAIAGASQFRSNCAFCHGLGAHGGGRGPDLTRVKKRHGTSDADLFRTINEGIAGTAMPANGNTGQGVGMTAEEIWQVIAYIRSVEKKGSAQSTGDAAHGQLLFAGSGGCATCHMVEGKGGRLGPDLTGGAAARSVDYIVDSVRNPSRRLAQGILESMKEFPQEYETVSVVTADGQKVVGVTLNEDNFSLQMMDTREQIHLFEKNKLRSVEKTRDSLMPAYDAKTLSDKDLQDIVAYLITVSAK